MLHVAVTLLPPSGINTQSHCYHLQVSIHSHTVTTFRYQYTVTLLPPSGINTHYPTPRLTYIKIFCNV